VRFILNEFKINRPERIDLTDSLTDLFSAVFLVPNVWERHRIADTEDESLEELLLNKHVTLFLE